MEADKDYIFINYSRADLPKVSPIVEEMRASGYNVWYDANIQPGKDWPDYIAAHIKDCAVCVAFHSQTSRDSPHCREEIHYALKHKKTVISVYLEDVTLKEGLDMRLDRFQSVRYSNPAELLETLRKSPEFERCGENIPNVSHKWKGVNLKKIYTALKKGTQSLFKTVALLVVVPLFIFILALIGHCVNQTPICFLDEASGVLDIISPPLSKVKMTDYSYHPDSTFLPPSWAAKVLGVKCAIIRQGVTSVGNSSFQNCSFMKFVIISRSVTSIGAEAFSGCTDLKQVQFSGGSEMQIIYGEAFADCTSLEEITIPNSIRFVYPNAFSGCSNLKTVHIQFATEKPQVQVVGNISNISNSSNADPDTLYIADTAFEPGVKIIFDPPDADADVVEYIWGSD